MCCHNNYFTTYVHIITILNTNGILIIGVDTVSSLFLEITIFISPTCY